MLQGRHCPDKSDINLPGPTSYHLVTGYLPSEDDMLEIDMFFLIERNNYHLYKRTWMECDPRMDACGWEMLQYDEQKRPSGCKALHRAREMKQSCVFMSRCAEYHDVFKGVLRVVEEAWQLYEDEWNVDDYEDDEDGTDDDGKESDEEDSKDNEDDEDEGGLFHLLVELDGEGKNRYDSRLTSSSASDGDKSYGMTSNG